MDTTHNSHRGTQADRSTDPLRRRLRPVRARTAPRSNKSRQQEPRTLCISSIALCAPLQQREAYNDYIGCRTIAKLHPMQGFSKSIV